MSNMTSVKSALDAEIKHAKEGIAFYSMRIATLEKIIAQLDQLDGDRSGVPGKTGKRSYTRKDKTAQSGAGETGVRSGKSAGKTAVKSSRSGGKLPATTARFWQGLLSETPISNKEIIDAAITALNIKPNATDLKKLKQRLANAITIMTRDGSMQSDGTGRARRFFIQKS